LLLWVIVPLSGCGGTQVVDPNQDLRQIEFEWKSTLQREHPLVNRIWSSAKGAFVTPQDLLGSLRASRVMLLGERHDQPDHHQIQAWVVERLEPGALIGFEMLDEADRPRLLGVQDAKTLARKTRWADSGWPDFAIYQPVFEALYKGGHTPVAIHPLRSRIRSLMTEPSSQQAVMTGKENTISAAGLGTLKADIETAHCGHASPDMVEAMVRAQRFKDRFMSTQLEMAAKGRQVVVITGNGHVQKDYGMPNYLTESSQSVGILEVDSKRLLPTDYQHGAYDFIWFTPRVDDLDACAKFRRALEKMRRRSVQSKGTSQ